MAGSRGDIEAGRAFVTLFLKDALTKKLGGVINQARAGLKQFASIVIPIGRALTKIGVAIGASYVALASGNALVVQKTQEIHRILANAIAPAVIPILEHAKQIAMMFARWAAANKGVLTTVLQLGIRLAFIGTVLKLIGMAAKGMAALLLGIRIVAAAIGTMIATTWVGPLLIVLAALAGITAIIYAISPTFRHFFNQNLADWGTWLRNVMSVLNSVVNAIKDGRFELAWRIVLTGMEISWKSWSDTINGLWLTMIDAILKLPSGPGVGPFAGWKKPLMELRDTLKGIAEEAKRGTELEAMKKGLKGLMDAADKRLPFTPFSSAGQIKSAITAGGAAALTFGTGTDDLPKRQFSEIQQMRRALHEQLRLQREMAAKRERPGIFGK